MTRRACLTIGVATVTPPPDEMMRFAYLDGAVLAARAIGEWALHSGFGADNVRIVDDEASPVTCARVQQAVNELFPRGADAVEHLILAFCGHGLTDENVGSISWLFSDSLSLKYRVVADKFYTELLFHKVQRITLISDACREAPKDIDLMRFDAVRGIVVQGGEVESPKFDRFVACQDGQLGYMVSESPAKPGKCVFTGVIADVLWGKEPTAISNGLITTASFGICVRWRTAERAKDYRLKLNPQCSVDPESTVLYDTAKPPQNLPELQPWPAAGAGAAMGPAAPEADAAGDAGSNFELARPDNSFRSSRRRAGFDLGSRGPRMTEKSVHETREQVREKARDLVAGEVRRSMVDITPSGDPDGPNLIVSGSGARLWSRDPVSPPTTIRAGQEFHVDSDAQGTPVLVELADHSFTPFVPYAGLYAGVKQSSTADVFQFYGRHDSQEAFSGALGAISDFAAGKIGADRIDELAGRLRSNKHADPALGAICAYLYRATADFDSIRRLAYFYVQHQQPVPFDIALLGAMKVTGEDNGALRLEVPAVRERVRGPGTPDLPDYVTAATPATEAWIAGRCPWLGLGWDYVGLPRPEWAALVDGLAAHASAVRRSGFTVLPNATGLALAESWKLQAR